MVLRDALATVECSRNGRGRPRACLFVRAPGLSRSTRGALLAAAILGIATFLEPLIAAVIVLVRLAGR